MPWITAARSRRKVNDSPRDDAAHWKMTARDGHTGITQPSSTGTTLEMGVLLIGAETPEPLNHSTPPGQNAARFKKPPALAGRWRQGIGIENPKRSALWPGTHHLEQPTGASLPPFAGAVP